MQKKPFSSKPAPQPSNEAGQSLVELAIIFSLLLLMFAGAVNFGRAFFMYLSLRDAAQEGAAYGSIDPGNTSEIEDRVYDNLENLQFDRAADVRTEIDITIQYFGPLCVGSIVQVDVNYPNFPLAMPFIGDIFDLNTISIHATVNDTILSPSTCP